MERKFWIEPKDPVMNNKEMINTIIEWAEKEGKKLEILSVDTEFPNLIIDGKKYIAKLEPPKSIMFNSGFGATKGFLNYKFIYFYEV